MSVTEEIEAAKQLSFFLNQSYQQNINTIQKDNEVVTSGGIALSSFDAALCLDDYIRTTRFLKGVYAAIQDLFQRFPEQKIHILYAGCGPYATLMLPLLPLFQSEQLEVILLDINEESISSVKLLIDAMGLQDYPLTIMQADAIQYQKPSSWPLHLLVTETMFHALIREPQVSITTNLAAQLEPDGILIPESIHIDLAYSFFGNEPYLKGEPIAFESIGIKGSLIYPQRYAVERLFTINKEREFSSLVDKSTHTFISKYYDLPEEYSAFPDICLLTRINIYKNQMLDSAESYITNPYCVASIPNFMDDRTYRLVYHIDHVPKWILELKG
jgi:lambda repressor-like predicted transcriptional regulator